jgi:hypothetical protein
MGITDASNIIHRDVTPNSCTSTLLKNAVFWDVTLWALVRTDGPEKTSASIIRVIFPRRMRRLLLTANVVPSSPILVTLMMQAQSSSETSIFTTATQRNIPKDGILRSHQRENPQILCRYVAVL